MVEILPEESFDVSALHWKARPITLRFAEDRRKFRHFSSIARAATFLDVSKHQLERMAEQPGGTIAGWIISFYMHAPTISSVPPSSTGLVWLSREDDPLVCLVLASAEAAAALVNVPFTKFRSIVDSADLRVHGWVVTSTVPGQHRRDFDQLGGAVEDTELCGAVEDTELGGAVEDTDLGGAVEDTKLGGAVEDTGLGGAVQDNESDSTRTPKAGVGGSVSTSVPVAATASCGGQVAKASNTMIGGEISTNTVLCAEMLIIRHDSDPADALIGEVEFKVDAAEAEIASRPTKKKTESAANQSKVHAHAHEAADAGVDAGEDAGTDENEPKNSVGDDDDEHSDDDEEEEDHNASAAGVTAQMMCPFGDAGAFECVCGRTFAKPLSLAGHKANCTKWISQLSDSRTRGRDGSDRTSPSTAATVYTKRNHGRNRGGNSSSRDTRGAKRLNEATHEDNVGNDSECVCGRTFAKPLSLAGHKANCTKWISQLSDSGGFPVVLSLVSDQTMRRFFDSFSEAAAYLEV
jgi:hypothetical protein